MKIKTALLSAALAGSMLVGGAAFSNSAKAAGIPGGVSNVSWGGSTATPLGGSFVFLNSAGVSPFQSAAAWTQTWYIPNTVYTATFSAPFGSIFYANSNDDGSIVYFGLPDTTTYGQTFYAPGGNLKDWTFLIANNPAAGKADFVVAT
jgi:hypothetical protein